MFNRLALALITPTAPTVEPDPPRGAAATEPHARRAPLRNRPEGGGPRRSRGDRVSCAR